MHMSGVRQGSALGPILLGPILFVIYINDIDGVCNNLKKIADDTNLFSQVASCKEAEKL